MYPELKDGDLIAVNRDIKDIYEKDDIICYYSIVEDKEAESNRAMREQSAGLISKVEYRMKIFGETKEVAEQKIREIQESNPSIDDLLGSKVEE